MEDDIVDLYFNENLELQRNTKTEISKYYLYNTFGNFIWCQLRVSHKHSCTDRKKMIAVIKNLIHR
jgi:hypothetical protein